MTLAPDPVAVAETADARSPWGDALRRLMANKAAVAAACVLALVALACLVGPLLDGHPYDRVFQSYVRVAPSLTPYPRDDKVTAEFTLVAARMRARVVDQSLAADTLRATLESPRAFDERLLAYLPRSDLFGTARVVSREDEGRRIVLDVPIRRETFPFGTDANGRDLLVRTLVAGRVSLAIGLVASFIALAIGVAWGSVAGYAGGQVDLVMMRVVDILYALPFIFFVILLVVFFGRNFILMFVAIGAIEWLDMARIVRGQTLALKRQEFVQAAEALGASPAGILVRHIVPNTLGPVIVYLTLLVPKVILLESFLSFLGLGVQEPMTSWGGLIAEGAANIQGQPSMLVLPATFLIATLFSLNFLGDGLRDALDPRDR